MSNASPDVSGTVFDDPMPELTRVYAEAFLGAVKGEGQEAVDELEGFATEVWAANPEFAELLNAPSVDARERDAILARALDGRVSTHLSHFLRVLSRRGRLELLGPVARRVRAEWDRRQGRRAVTVRTAVPLAADQEARLRERLAAMMPGQTPMIRHEIDPSLIGGMVVQIGDRVIDASVRTRHLERLRTRLTEGSSHEVLSRREAFTSA